jgi:hypothetical protein
MGRAVVTELQLGQEENKGCYLSHTKKIKTFWGKDKDLLGKR